MATLIFVWEELKRKNNEKADCAASTASPYSLTDLPFELIQASCLRLTKITMERLFTTILETVTPDKLGAAFEALGIDWVNECDALDNLKKTENFCSDKILESLKDEQITEQQIQEIHKHQFGDTQDQGYPYEIAFIRYVKTFGMLPSELYRRSQIPEDHPTEADQRINIKWLNLRYKGVMQQIEQSPIETTINFDPTTDTIENELLLLPSNIKTLQALTSINAAHMGLIAVSPELRELGNLKLLLNGGNNIEFIPPEIGDMEQLEILITYGNRLKAFYALLKKLPAFKAFNIEDNQLSAQENQKIEAYCQANKIINFKSD